MSIDTPKIRQNVDLINAFCGCPMGKPLNNCPFIPLYKLSSEHEQIMQIEILPQKDLDRMRFFHRSCMENYRERKRNKILKLKNDLGH